MLELLRRCAIRTGRIREWAGRGRDQSLCALHAAILSRRVATRPDELLRVFGELDHQPLKVAFEATFGWGWFADLLADAGIPAHMAHPLATKAIPSARVKNDSWTRRPSRTCSAPTSCPRRGSHRPKPGRLAASRGCGLSSSASAHSCAARSMPCLPSTAFTPRSPTSSARPAEPCSRISPCLQSRGRGSMPTSGSSMPCRRGRGGRARAPSAVPRRRSDQAAHRHPGSRAHHRGHRRNRGLGCHPVPFGRSPLFVGGAHPLGALQRRTHPARTHLQARVAMATMGPGRGRRSSPGRWRAASLPPTHRFAVWHQDRPGRAGPAVADPVLLRPSRRTWLPGVPGGPMRIWIVVGALASRHGLNRRPPI